MPYFPRLPLVDEIFDAASRHGTNKQLEQIAIVAVQHLLETTGSLFEALIRFGFLPNQLFVLGKSYSTIPHVERALLAGGVNVFSAPGNGSYRQQMERGCELMWLFVASALPKSVNRIIVLDEGGYCVRTVPESLRSRQIIGIEQTRSGLHNNRGRWCTKFPVILVASCAVKKQLEPRLIAREVASAAWAVLQKSRPGSVYGVLGVGHIGMAIVAMLVRQGHKVYIFDHNESKMRNILALGYLVTLCDTREELMKNSDVIFGCTGRDALSKVTYASMGSKRVVELVSCSSGDLEFFSLLSSAAHEEAGGDPFCDRVAKRGTYTFAIKNGGCPINFTRVRELSSPEEIQLTRALLGGAVIQAIASFGLSGGWGGEKLSPTLQRGVASRWLSTALAAEYPSDVVEHLKDIKWISNKSSGTDRGALEKPRIDLLPTRV